MHHPTDTHRTAKDLSPEELAEYNRRLDQHLRNREVDEALLHTTRLADCISGSGYAL